MIIRRKKQEVPGLNTTSTADISFMLLIFFLVTTSMDVDKGLTRLLPAPSNAKQPQESVVDKSTLMELYLGQKDSLTVNGTLSSVDDLTDEAVRFVRRVGDKHVISLNSSRDADYDLYFRVQDHLMQAYSVLRDSVSRVKYHRAYAALSAAQKDKICQAVPVRISESYAQAHLRTGKNMADDEEKKEGGAE